VVDIGRKFVWGLVLCLFVITGLLSGCLTMRAEAKPKEAPPAPPKVAPPQPPKAEETAPPAPPETKAQPEVPKPPAKPRTATYVVEKGDNLSKIAKKFYGDPNKWRKIYEANRDRIKDPNKIRPGQVLVIPLD